MARDHIDIVYSGTVGRITGTGVAATPEGLTIVDDALMQMPIMTMMFTYQCGPNCFTDHPDGHQTQPGMVELDTAGGLIAAMLEQADRDGNLVRLMAEVDRMRVELRDAWRASRG